MTALAHDLLLVAVANALVASLLALLAWVLLRQRRHAAAHLLCVLALVKLLTPPLWRLPLLAATEPVPAPTAEAWLDTVLAGTEGAGTEGAAAEGGPTWAVLVVAAALFGSCLLAARAVLRTRHFRRMLGIASEPPPALVARARTLARRMQLRRCPHLLVVPARISPMLCVLGRRAHILLPRALLAAPGPEVDALLAHELAHASRRDHWVRALEVLATVLCWWLPTTWFLRRTLRAAEERCCDERVLAALPGGSRDYAHALLTTLDLLAGAARGMPPVACGAGAFTDMKTRLTMIMTAAPSRPMSWTLRAALLLGAAAVLPIAPIFAQEQNDKPVSREELRAARAEIRKLRAELEALRAELNEGLAGRPERGVRGPQRPAAGGRDLDGKPNDEQARPDHDEVRDLIEKFRGRQEEMDAADRDKLKKAIMERLHRGQLDKAMVDHDHVRGLLQKIHGHEGELNAADKDKLKKSLMETLHREQLDKVKIDHDHVRSLLQKVHGHEAELNAADKDKLKKSLLETLHREQLDKVKIDHDHVRSLLQKIHGHDAELNAADKDKLKRAIMEALHRGQPEKVRVDKPRRVDLEESEAEVEREKRPDMAR